jgi:FkbM family methyltransferase
MRPAGLPIKYRLDGRDAIGEILFWRGPSIESATVPIFAKYARKARGVLDVGANTGLYSLIACAANPAARVKAWEPVPHLHEKLQANLRENAFESRCEARRAAASDVPGTATLYIPIDSTTMASLHSDHNQERTTSVQVGVETIDSAIPPDFPVDLIKLDVESHEHAALLGMQRTLARFKPIIIFECLPNTPARPIEDLLFGLGYQLSRLLNSGPRRIDRISDSPEFQAEYNYLASHPLSASF